MLIFLLGITEKSKKRDDLLSLYEIKSKETNEAEKLIKKEIADLKEKIESMLLIKKRDNFATSQTTKKVEDKILSLESAVSKLSQEEKDLEARLENIQKITDDNYQSKVALFKKIVKPLDDTRKLAIDEREIVSDKISQAEQKIVSLTNEISQTHSDFQSQKELRNDLIENKIELHKTMDKYNANYPDEVVLFHEEEKNKKEILELQKKQEDLKVLLAEANNKREIIRDEIIKIDDKIALLQDDYNIILDNLKTATKAGESEIVKMENYINRTAIEYDASTLNALIDQVCQDRYWYSTSNKIYIKQIKLAESYSEKITIDYNDKIDSIKTEIVDIKQAINVLKPKVKAVYSSLDEEKSTEESQRDSKVIARFKAKAGNLKQCLEDLRSTKLEFKCRIEALDRWILKKKAFIAKDDEDKIDSDELLTSELDNSVLESFLKNILYKIEDFGSKKKLEEMLGFYIDKVARREKAIQHCFWDSLKVKKTLDESHEQLKNLKIND